MSEKDDKKTAEESLEVLTKAVEDTLVDMKKTKAAQEESFKALREELGKKADGESVAKVKELSESFATFTADLEKMQGTVALLKKEMDTPLMRGGKDLAANDKDAAVELQKRAFIHKGGAEDDFRPDLENLVKATDYRSAANKLMRVGIESRQKIMRSFTEDERKAFDAASLDAGFFSPEMLGLEIDCEVECASLLDLYDSISVSKTTFQYPFIRDYGALGEYGCDASCDGPMGPEGNIEWRNGRVNDYRGVFCLTRNVLVEANYDLLAFMYRAIQRSHRINRNQELITGKGGWLTGNCFEQRATPAGGTLPAEAYRAFVASVPWDYGTVTAVMHQNMFAYLISIPKAMGGFVFADGELCINPDNVAECIRISNCLPDPTENLTLGSEAAPFAAGAFLAAAANWDAAYAAVNKRPLWIEQFEGGSSAWCVMYQFGAEDGGFTKCCDAGRMLVAGGPRGGASN